MSGTVAAVIIEDPPLCAGACYLYGRSWSPTVHTLGRQLAVMEDTEAAYAVSSGEGADAELSMVAM